MSLPPLTLGLDVGTTGTKALLVGADGAVRASVTTPHALSTPRPLWSEQDPHDWWRAAAASARAVLERSGVPASAIAAVGLTGQMHGLVLLDARGGVLRPAILWNDQRTAAQCSAMHDRVGRDAVIRITGKPALPGFTAPKVLWVRDEEPDVYEAVATILLPKDYVRYRLTGARHTDVADASGTSLLDVGRRRWSEEILSALDIPREWLPEVAESPLVTAAVSAEGAAATGLRAGTPVVAGAGDQAAEAIGCGIVEGGGVSVTVGTSGVVFAATDGLRVDPEGRLHAFCHAVPGAWHVMGVMLSAGGSLRWWRDVLRSGEPAVTDADARRSRRGSAGSNPADPGRARIARMGDPSAQDSLSAWSNRRDPGTARVARTGDPSAQDSHAAADTDTDTDADADTVAHTDANAVAGTDAPAPASITYDDLMRAAAAVPAGCEGLLFLPYLSGERTPHADPGARGAFVGLTVRHGPAHLTRAVLEGVAFGLADCLDLVRAIGIDVARVRLSGGGARSAVWRRIMADVFGVEVATVNVTEGAAFGAAVLAAVGAGVHATVPDAARAIVRETDVTEPGPDAPIYRSLHETYRALYPTLAPTFERLGFQSDP